MEQFLYIVVRSNYSLAFTSKTPVAIFLNQMEAELYAYKKDNNISDDPKEKKAKKECVLDDMVKHSMRSHYYHEVLKAPLMKESLLSPVFAKFKEEKYTKYKTELMELEASHDKKTGVFLEDQKELQDLIKLYQ